MSLTDLVEQDILDAFFGQNSALGPPTNFYVALANAQPNDAGSFSEITGSAYARVLVANSSGEWVVAASGKKNVNAIEFPVATGNWNGGASFGYFGLFDASTGGNLLAYGALASAQTVLTGQQLAIPANGLTITLD